MCVSLQRRSFADRKGTPLMSDFDAWSFRSGGRTGDEAGAITPTTPTFSTEVSVSGIYGVTGRATILDFGPALDTEQCIGGVVVVALLAQHCRLFRQLMEQRLGVLQVGGIEALGEPAVDFSEHRARLGAAALLVEEPR